ncbi:four helix bundle protein [Arcicella aurantiaca]|uniref:Four helix bundle protein n=1 Tax=Arcicella aurantiaca TaxID=591202 RepID=A0A316E950_9BACT|nr:four helix bundle protein [Arcicella aurantiaca]PWK26188.1 four helix bundle protein [Arcicella aurantiaca]
MNDSTPSKTQDEFAEMLFQRIKSFGLRCIPVCDNLFQKSLSAKNIAGQLVRSSASSVANYRAARRSRSSKEFFAKLSIVIEELDESLFWLEYSIDANFHQESKLKNLIDEGSEILKILSKSRKTVGDALQRKNNLPD